VKNIDYTTYDDRNVSFLCKLGNVLQMIMTKLYTRWPGNKHGVNTVSDIQHYIFPEERIHVNYI